MTFWEQLWKCKFQMKIKLLWNQKKKCHHFLQLMQLKVQEHLADAWLTLSPLFIMVKIQHACFIKWINSFKVSSFSLSTLFWNFSENNCIGNVIDEMSQGYFNKHAFRHTFILILFRIDKRHWAGELIILEILIVIHKHHYHLYYHLVPLFCTNLICNCKNYCLYIWIVRIPQVQYYKCTSPVQPEEILHIYIY